MPKRDGHRGARFSSLSDFYNEHDERDRKDRSNRRVSFKHQGPTGFKNRTEMAIRQRLEDDDDISDFVNSTSKSDARYNGPRRKGSPIPKGKFGRKLIASEFGWYQVNVQSGQKYSKDEVINEILNIISPMTFIPHYWRTENNCVVFYVDDFHVAERLLQIDHGIQMPDGYRVLVRLRNGYPRVPVDDDFKEKMKTVMAKRYNVNTKALDLSKFHADPEFKNMFCGLFRLPVMSAALDIMEKNIPDIEALNLNENSITTMENFKNISERLPHLKILYLDNNKLQSLAHLLVLRNVPIIELMLKANPLRQRYKDISLYVSEVRRKFPKLKKLDGALLEPNILLEGNNGNSPIFAKASYLCDVTGADVVCKFVEQYFAIFDSDNRQPLLEAYQEQAMLSISVPPASQAGRLTSFWKYNRNFRRIINNDDPSRSRNLKIGRLAIVSTLADWPKTQHDPQSFTLDLTLYTPQLIGFIVSGLFKEFENSTGNSSNFKSGEVRYFQRQLVIVPAGGGFCIRNELILVTSATSTQAKTFMKPHAQAATSNEATTSAQARLLQSNPSATTIISQANEEPVQIDESTKMQMVQAMSTQSNMNLAWSKKCLDETNWNYNHAISIFEKLHKANKIPAEAFIK